MFTACKFTFDGISCSHYGLMLYDIGGQNNSETAIGTAEIEETEAPSHSKPFFHRVKRNKPLEFTLTFGADMGRVDARVHLAKPEISSIAHWLCQDRYKKLTIDQADMTGLFYRCIITDLLPISIDGVTWAFTASVRCDAPYAYRVAQIYSADATAEDGATLKIKALHNIDEYYFPVVNIAPTGSGTISLTNTADNSRSFVLTELPAGTGSILADGERGIITASSNKNIYPYCNFRFLRLLRD